MNASLGAVLYFDDLDNQVWNTISLDMKANSMDENNKNQKDIEKPDGIRESDVTHKSDEIDKYKLKLKNIHQKAKMTKAASPLSS
jgi:hypothetical protein